MNILWIGKRPAPGGEGGDEVFDSRTIAACRDLGHQIDLFHPTQSSRVAEVARLVLGYPHQRARFTARADRQELLRIAQRYDAIIVCPETFDMLARGLPTKTILITHNITSEVLPAIFPGNPLASLAAARVRAWERRCYTKGGFWAIGAVSRRDQDYLARLGVPAPLLLPPGMPPSKPLAADADLRRELVISGTFTWRPKLHGLMQFAREYAALPRRETVRATDLPDAAATLLQPLARPTAEENQASIRFGLITDRFTAGHKLKTTDYLANNQIVLSFAEVAFDYARIPDHAFFIRRITSVAEIAEHMDAVAAEPIERVRERFVRFKQACAETFNWHSVATTLLQSLQAPARTVPQPVRRLTYAEDPQLWT